MIDAEEAIERPERKDMGKQKNKAYSKDLQILFGMQEDDDIWV